MIVKNCPGRLEIANGPMIVVQLGAGPLNHVCRDKEGTMVTSTETGVFRVSQKLDKYSPWSLEARDHYMTITPADTLIKFTFTRGALCFIYLNDNSVKKCPWA